MVLILPWVRALSVAVGRIVKGRSWRSDFQGFGVDNLLTKIGTDIWTFGESISGSRSEGSSGRIGQF